MPTTIKLLVACRDEQAAFALCAQVVQAGGGEFDGQATHIGAALRRAAAASPDVLLLEHVQDEPDSARHVLSRIRQVSENTRVLLSCDSYTYRSIVKFLQQGASGCILTSSEPSLHAKAVRTVQQGETWFGRTELLQALRSQLRADPVVATDLLEDQALLTPREREILLLIGSALSNKEIARRLQISDQTVKTHLHHIYVKLRKSGRYKAFLSKAALGLG